MNHDIPDFYDVINKMHILSAGSHITATCVTHTLILPLCEPALNQQMLMYKYKR